MVCLGLTYGLSFVVGIKGEALRMGGLTVIDDFVI